MSWSWNAGLRLMTRDSPLKFHTFKNSNNGYWAECKWDMTWSTWYSLSKISKTPLFDIDYKVYATKLFKVLIYHSSTWEGGGRLSSSNLPLIPACWWVYNKCENARKIDADIASETAEFGCNRAFFSSACSPAKVGNEGKEQKTYQYTTSETFP